MTYPGTRKKTSLHPRNGSHPLGDAYRNSGLPCSHADMLSVLTQRRLVRSSGVLVSDPEVFNGCVEITGVQIEFLFLCAQSATVCHCTCLPFCRSLPLSLFPPVCPPQDAAHLIVTVLLLCLQFAFWMN